MVKHILFSATIVCITAAFSPVVAQKMKQGTTTAAKADLKFLDDITIEVPAAQETGRVLESGPKSNSGEMQAVKKTVTTPILSGYGVETANILQFKYALLLDVEVEKIQNLNLFKVLDEWLGTHYKLGGSTKAGIDCSAFMQVLFSSLYGITLPRTAREQYNCSHKISRTDLKEGDLVFFNTVGGVSHVGMYLQNNKFIHASSSGVTISDLFDEYWIHRFVGVRRIEGTALTALFSQP